MKKASKNKRNRGEHKNDKTVTTIVGGSMVRAVYRWEFPGKNKRAVVIRFSRIRFNHRRYEDSHQTFTQK